MKNDGIGRGQHSDDEALIARLGEMFDEVDQPPALAVEVAKLSYGLLALDAEMAALTADSDIDAAGVVVRDEDPTSGPRLLSFEAADLSVEIEIAGSGRHRRVLGQLLPAQPTRVEVRQPASSVTRWIDVDERGRFVIDGVSAGPISLTCHRPGQRAIATQWTWVE